MIDYKFVFDLDSTITKEEVLPLVAKEIGLYEEVQQLTEKAMNGLESFSENFINRVNMLKSIPLEKIHKVVENVELNEYIEKFILENREKCYIITGNLDIIIKPILKKLNMEGRYFSCEGTVKNNKIHSVTKVINKKDVVEKFDFKFVAIGDGDNDIEMLKLAEVGIGFGGSREISLELKNSADYVIYNDKELYSFLYNLMRG